MSNQRPVSASLKKKRLIQLRDAQRRRRERLKEDRQHFVQIILSEKVLEQIRQMSLESGETVQHIIGDLIERSLPENPDQAAGKRASAPAEEDILPELEPALSAPEKSDSRPETDNADNVLSENAPEIPEESPEDSPAELAPEPAEPEPELVNAAADVKPGNQLDLF